MKRNKKSASHNYSLKKPSEKKFYDEILKTATSVSEERTFEESDTEGTNSGGRDSTQEQIKKPFVKKKSSWLKFRDNIKDNIIVWDSIFGFIAIIVGVTIWFNNLARDVQSMKKDIDGLRTSYALLNSNQTNNTHEIDLLKQELKQQIDSLTNRAAQLENKLTLRYFIK